MKSYRFLRSGKVTREEVEKRLAGKPSVELLRAVHNPDHSRAGIDALKAILRDRGMSEEQIEAFRWSSEDLAVPRFGTNPTVEAALRRPIRWRRIYRGIQVTCVTLVILLVPLTDEEKRLRIEQRQADVYHLIDQNLIDAEETMGGIALLGAIAGADATATATPTVEAYVAANTTVTISGMLTVTAGSSQTAKRVVRVVFATSARAAAIRLPSSG